MAEQRLFSDADLARALGVSKQTVQRWVRQGQLSGAGMLPSGRRLWSETVAKAVVAQATGASGTEAEARLAEAVRPKGRPRKTPPAEAE